VREQDYERTQGKSDDDFEEVKPPLSPAEAGARRPDDAPKALRWIPSVTAPGRLRPIHYRHQVFDL
jgi:hypothetical protein